MHFLTLAILCSVSVTLLFKLAARRGRDLAVMIAVNYVVALGFCLLWLPAWPQPGALHTPWALLLTIGLLLPVGFLMMGAAVRHAGVVRSDAAQRLSICMPLLAAFVWFGQPLTGAATLGLLLAAAAMGLLLRATPAADTPIRPAGGWLLAGVWVVYGSIDTLFKQVARFGDPLPVVLTVCFCLAALVMVGYLLARRQALRLPDLRWGVALGALNTANIFCYLAAHRALPEHPALVFTAMNIGVIALGALAGAGLFREQPGKRGWAGVALAISAVVALWPR